MLFAIFSILMISKRFVEHGDSGIRLADKDVILSRCRNFVSNIYITDGPNEI